MTIRSTPILLSRRVVFLLAIMLAVSAAPSATPPASTGDGLAKAFLKPPDDWRPWCYWWWFHGCVTRDGIVRDLDHMKAVGIGGAMVNQFGLGPHVAPVDPPPFKVEFMSPPWRELFKFAVEEAAKRGIVIGFNMCAGFDAGGPWVTAEEAPQFLSARAARVKGPRSVTVELPEPWPKDAGYHRDVAVLAWQNNAPPPGGAVICRRDTMIDLTSRMQNGQLVWDVPAGDWVVLRFACHTSPRLYRAYTKFGDGPKNWEIDPLRSATMDRHFAATVGVLVGDVPQHVGRTLQFVQIDSSEIDWPDWTPAFREEFQRRRGYDPFPYLAAKARMLVETPEITARFQEDYDRTRGDLVVDNYYGRLAALARRHGLLTSSQGGGYQKPRVDALRAIGVNDICESEYWARNSDRDEERPGYIHQLAEPQLRYHDAIRTAASAAHTYGRRIVMAEAFSGKTMGFPNYDKYPYALKDLSDRAFCAGLNQNLFLLYVHQPYEDRKPGYAFGHWQTDLSRHITWWNMGEAWQAYLARCQGLLRAGVFAADVCYFAGEWVPSFVPARWAMNPELPPGYDCDTVTAEVLGSGSRVAADGRLELSSGMRYRYLVFNQGGRWADPPGAIMFPKNEELGLEAVPAPTVGPPQSLALSPEILAAIQSLVEAGMTLVGPPAVRAVGLTGYPDSDAKVARLVSALWGEKPGATGERRVGRGRVIWGRSLREIFAADTLAPDVQIREDAATAQLGPETLSGIPNPTGSFDWIHRRLDGADLYFVANLRRVAVGGEFTFRVAGRRPELWDPVTGTGRDLPQWSGTPNGRTVIPLQFAPRQSFFVVFRDAAPAAIGNGEPKNFPAVSPLMELTGPWEVRFDPQWFYPDQGIGGKVTFDRLVDWAQRPEEAIRFYSGTATYQKRFDLPSLPTLNRGLGLFIDLGKVKHVARVRLNGRDLGIVWTAPWRVEIGQYVKEKGNVLEIDVVNLWPNRLIGDAGLPADQRRTMTNLLNLKSDSPLFSSGLLGPVTLMVASD